MHVHIISHADLQIPFIIKAWLHQHRFKASFSKPFEQASIQVFDYDFLIILGGPQNISENLLFLREEIHVIKQAIKKRIPMLGICLGAQLMGEAFGAKTEKSPHQEKGIFPLQFTENGCNDPLLYGLSNSMPALHWHSDMPGLSENAKVLAFSKGCPRQMIRYEPFAYGIQCHLEANQSKIQTMMTHSNHFPSSKYVQSDHEILNGDFEKMNSSMNQILNNFIYIIRKSK